jgi:hypothetical protein
VGDWSLGFARDIIAVLAGLFEEMDPIGLICFSLRVLMRRRGEVASFPMRESASSQ